MIYTKITAGNSAYSLYVKDGCYKAIMSEKAKWNFGVFPTPMQDSVLCFDLYPGDIIYYSYNRTSPTGYQIHNDSGAAIEKANGDKIYYLDGVKYSKKEYERMLKLIILK